MIDPHIYI